MSSLKQQHYVPKSHLDDFAKNDGYLEVYYKEKNKYFKSLPQNIMRQNKFYKQNWVPNGIDPNILEQFFDANLENQYKKSFNKLINNHTSINSDDAALIMNYLTIQKIRIPSERERGLFHLESFLSERIKTIPNYKNLLKNLKLKLDDSAWAMVMKAQIPIYNPYFSRMVWQIYKTDSNNFIITDNPVVFFNEKIYPPDIPGIGLIGTELIFPISSQYILKLTHPEYYSPDPLKKLSSNIEIKNSLTVCPPKQISKEESDFYNFVLFTYSNNFIAGNSKETLESLVQSHTS